MRKFKSSCKESEKLVYEKFSDDETYSNENKVLGILWDKQRDQLLIFALNLLKNQRKFHNLISSFDI